MRTSRLEAFSDGVLAIVITIMVLELRVPIAAEGHVATFSDLTAAHLVPVFFSYVLSFVYVAIYWNNHHHLMSTADHVSGPIMWANMHLLFWLSLVPFSTKLARREPWRCPRPPRSTGVIRADGQGSPTSC